MGSSKQESCYQRCKYTFQHITYKCHGTGFSSHGAHGIGGSRIAAAIFADINAVQSANDIGGLHKTKSIANDQTQQTYQHMFIPYPFSLLR